MFFRQQLGDRAAQRLRRTGELRRAVSNGEIVPFYQPLIELASGKVVAVEALARWHHPELGWVPAGEFLPLAETTGLIDDLGRQIIDRSFADTARWLRQGRRLQLNVNVSGMQLTSSTLLPTIDAALREAQLPPKQLTIEITETAAIRDAAGAMYVLKALRQRGITLALDDFGTGYSPLTALRDLPVAAIKLDRTFVAGLGSPEGDDLAAGIVQLGLAVGMHIVAEGVESRAQADQLHDMGCAYAQGYLWSPAVPGTYLLDTIARIESAIQERSKESRLRNRHRPVVLGANAGPHATLSVSGTTA